MAKHWSDSEIDLILNSYFVMLEHEQTGRAFSKSDHRRELMKYIERSKKAIEFKHMNISAVMDALGLPYISGYTPLGNFQKKLVKAVETYLKENPELHKLLVGEIGVFPPYDVESSLDEVIVFDEKPPQRQKQEKDISKDTESIVSRFEYPAERDARNRRLGEAGELLVYEYERLRLQTVGRQDLSECVRWIARDEGDGFGYDIRSFNGAGDKADQELWLEVKTTNGSAITPFYITRNELQVSKQWPDAYRIFRLYDFRKQVRAFCLAPPLEKHVSLTPTILRASFK